MTFESIASEADKMKDDIAVGAATLNDRLQHLIDEILKMTADVLNKEKDSIMDKFWKEYEESIVKKHREIDSAMKKYKEGVDVVGVSILRDEIEKTVKELSRIAEMWSLPSAEQSKKMHLESMRQFREKWRLEAFSKDLMMIEIDSLNLKISQEMKKVVWSNASVEFSTIFNTYPGVSGVTGSLAGNLFIGESSNVNNTSMMDASFTAPTGLINPVKPKFLSVVEDLPKEPTESVRRSKKIFDKKRSKDDLVIPSPILNDSISTTITPSPMISQSAPLTHMIGVYPSLTTANAAGPCFNLYAHPEIHSKDSGLGVYYVVQQPPVRKTWVSDYYQ